MKYTQSRDKLTGKKLKAIQVWVEPEIHAILVNIAVQQGRALKSMLRMELSRLAQNKE